LAPETNHTETFATAVTEVTERMTVLVREEIELAKVEMTTKVSSIARGAAAVAAGAVFGVFALVFGLLSAAWGINAAFSGLWEGFVIVFGILMFLTIAAFLFAWRKLKVGAPTPKMAIDEAKLIRETVTTTTQDGA
jgi:membrane protein YdbS with pleckstrin-like domain